jgi:hypothetical protein
MIVLHTLQRDCFAELGDSQDSNTASPIIHANNAICIEDRFWGINKSYSGTSLSPNSGLGQGSGASPPVFLALSSLIVNAYRRLGHGAKIFSSYVGRLFYLSAVMYDDDTDLLHWPDSANLDPDNLIAYYVQQATMDYDHLAQASGSILREKKCLVYFMDYIYVRRRAKLKSL